MKIALLLFLYISFLEANEHFKNCDQIIDKQVYKICYDYNYKGALFVSYTLDGALVNNENIKKRPKFYNEKIYLLNIVVNQKTIKKVDMIEDI